jgi:hypothetical protein
MEVSHAPSAPGFDPLGNPVPLGEALGDTSRSYRREGGAGSLPDWSARDLDWGQWLSAQPPQAHGSSVGSNSSAQYGMGSSSGMENLSHALQHGTRTPVNIMGPGSFASMSQWQLHQTSTHKTMGPMAQGFFRVRHRTSTAASARARSTDPAMRLGPGGRMLQRSSTSSGRRSAPLPKPSWQRNRRNGGLSPLRAPQNDTAAPHQQNRMAGQPSTLPSATRHKGARKCCLSAPLLLYFCVTHFVCMLRRNLVHRDLRARTVGRQAKTKSTSFAESPTQHDAAQHIRRQRENAEQ